MAQDAAEEFNVSPQEALLGFVRAAAGRSAWLDTVVREKLRRHVEGGGDPFDPPDELVRWLRQSRDERSAATRTAKAAVDAGVMVALERRLDVEGEVVADALAAVLDVLDLDHDQRVLALTTAQARLSGDPLPEAPARVVEEPVGGPDLMADFREFCAAEGVDPDGLDDEEDGDDDTE
ncbi:hypothetical protein [Streptomyces lincolnensis]|uniref:hypothetical protein n=1 Tax=Streptomyces lincolnensis TaxID=1915 RepID=UPI0037D67016